MNVPKPMLAAVSKKAFDSPNHFYEGKLDGTRCYLVYDCKEGLRFLSRSLKDKSAGLPDFQDLMLMLNDSIYSCIIDCEFVATNPEGEYEFELAQGAFGRTTPSVVQARIDDPNRYFFQAFDILAVNRLNLTSEGSAWGYTKRKKALKQVVHPTSQIEILPWVHQYGIQAYEEHLGAGLEGTIAKTEDGLYYPGKRTKDWLKIKPIHVNAEEDTFLIVGWTKGREGKTGKRAEYFGGFLIAKLNGGEHAEGYKYCGVAGSGLKDDDLKSITPKLKSLEMGQDSDKMRNAYGFGIPRNDIGGFIYPPIPADFKYQSRTADGKLRFPVFLRLREDREWTEIVE